jgi:hypothetical protein
MSHRSALTVSLALTIVLAIGIIAGRDRLFDAADTVPSAIAPAPAVSLDDTVPGSEQPVVSDGPRVIDIPLPATDHPSEFDRGDDERQRANDGEHEREWHDEDDEHEGYDDD